MNVHCSRVPVERAVARGDNAHWIAAAVRPLSFRPMPELAEVEYYRRQWDCGLNRKVLGVQLHAGKRIFRETDARALVAHVTGRRLQQSTARGKQMLFRFSGDSWLGIHLGMSGTLRSEPAEFRPGKHDHLVLRQAKRALVFRDPRQFGRVRFHHGKSDPLWWNTTVPEIISIAFTLDHLRRFLARHERAPIKAVLLLQSGFPGIGNWMADEILWRAKIAPQMKSGALTRAQRGALRRATRFVSSAALRIVGPDNSALPPGWLIHQRWTPAGKCPRDQTKLRRDVIAARTTAWCPVCQGVLPKRQSLREYQA